jgi:uncharacterized protein involved in exopolysaccharide biosynthesis
MRTEYIASNTGDRSFSARDFLAVGFRHKRAVTLCFSGILLGTILAAIFLPPLYKSSTKFLIEHERMDPVASPGQGAQQMVRPPVTEEELNSEVELLKSEDVLRQVVLANGLQNRKSLSYYIFGAPDEVHRIAKAVNRLAGNLTIEAIKKSNLIDVHWYSTDPRLAASVLNDLGDAYLKKNVAVHHPPGQFEFFDQGTAKYQKDLADAEAQLKAFSEEEGGVSPQVTTNLTLGKLNEFQASLQQTKAEMASTEERIRDLERQAGITPERLTTEKKQADDAQVLQGLKNTLMTLELKRTELLTKYQPTYPLVQEVDKELAQTRASIAAEDAKPVREETTDRNPTYAWINEELAKAKSDYAGLQARATATQAIVAQYQARSRDLDQKGLIEGDLLRNMKATEENYLLYLRKREEAKMEDAMNDTRILSVAIAQQPIVPTLPAIPPVLIMAAGTLLAIIASLGLAFALEYLDPSFRTPSEVMAELNIPVLAAVSHRKPVEVPTGGGGLGPLDHVASGSGLNL